MQWPCRALTISFHIGVYRYKINPSSYGWGLHQMTKRLTECLLMKLPNKALGILGERTEERIRIRINSRVLWTLQLSQQSNEELIQEPSPTNVKKFSFASSGPHVLS